jgi:protein TonB
MSEGFHDIRRDRIKAAIGVAAFHALLGYALVTGLGMDVVREAGENLKLIRISPEPPPPQEEPIPAKAATPDEEGAASPPNLKAKPTPVVAPPPKIRLKPPPKIPTAPKAFPVPAGSDASAGSSNVPGPGSGSGGQGTGSGSGSGGSGTGGGGGVSKAVRLQGRLDNKDYPASARRARIGGSVSVLFTVQTSGRVSGCRVVKSSGNADLDSTTCRLIEQRFVYKPATDPQGSPVQSVISTTFSYNWVVPPASATPRRD